MAIIKNRALRLCIFILGILSVVLGTIGIFLPILPTTPFVLLAAWCFLNSSEKAHRWIIQQPLFGKAIVDWERNQAIARPNKVLAIVMITFSIIIIWIKVSNLWIKYSISLVLLVVSIFIASRNEK